MKPFNDFCHYFAKNFVNLCHKFIVKTWQVTKDQPPFDSTCKEEEIQSFVIQAIGFCTYDCFEMVYYSIATSIGDTDEWYIRRKSKKNGKL